jgi:hypothetical protein
MIKDKLTPTQRVRLECIAQAIAMAGSLRTPKSIIEKAKEFEMYLNNVESIREETYRNARAYAWEIGHGHPLTERIEKMSSENPFSDPNWRDKIEHHENLPQPTNQEAASE